MNKIVVFGASGDLAKRKLMPAISKIHTKDLQVIGYSRSDLEGSFAQEMRKFFDYKTDFPEQVKYIRGQYDNLSPLKDVIDSSTILYFSVPPIVHDQILSGLASFDFGVLGVEKPFGNDFESFKKSEYFRDSRVRFIDHYLLKPLMLSITELLRKDGPLFAFLSSETVGCIDCHFIESLLVEGRSYFDGNGIVRDVMQNHLVEVVSTILCNSQDDMSSPSRIDFIKSLRIDHRECVFGQYETYQRDVRMGSKTETFALFRCSSENEKWKNVPILMMAGKGLNRKATELVLGIKRGSFRVLLGIVKDKTIHPINEHKIEKMELVFNVAPAGEVYLRILVGGVQTKIVLYDCNHVEKIKASHFGDYQDYEIIFSSLINESYLPSISYEEALELWSMFDAINSSRRDLVYYKNGSEMPEGARRLIDTIKKVMND